MYLTIDDAYAEWYEEKYGEHLDRNMVLPVLKALQGHPESGRLWEKHITAILMDLGFWNTTHDKTIYRNDYTKSDGSVETIYLLRQVDDFALACKAIWVFAVGGIKPLAKARRIGGRH